MNKQAGWVRWLILAITCVTMFAQYYCYDNPVALQHNLQESYDLSILQYNLLYSVYAFPNAIIPFFGGILTDVLGVDIMLIVFFSLIVVGHGTFILGCILDYFPTMLMGRFLFGTGCESYALVETPFIYEYFKEKELAFALGVNLSLARIGSSANDFFTFYTYEQTDSIIFALSVGWVMTIASWFLLLALLFYRYMQRKKESKKAKSKNNKNIQQKSKNKVPEPSFNDLTQSMMAAPPPDDAYDLALESSDFSLGRQVIGNSPKLMDGQDEFDNTGYRQIESESNVIAKTNVEPESEKFKFSDIKSFDVCYWLLVLNCGLIYGCVQPWMNVGSDFMKQKYAYDHSRSNLLLMIPYIICGIFTPFFGYVTDKVGKRVWLLLMSTVLCVISHFILGWVRNKEGYLIYPMLALTGLGIAFSIFCAVIWPSFTFLVDPKMMGTAYGIPVSFYNAVLSLFFILIGVLADDHDNPDKYKHVEWFLMGVSIVSVFSVLILMYYDRKTGNRLNASPRAKKQSVNE